MKQPTSEQMLGIVHTYISSGIPTLKARNSDSLDFFNVAVWNLEAALLAAYELGAKSAAEQE